jgi:molybdopterin-binding protein
MPQYRISEAAELLGVSDDTIRRWIDSGRLISSAKDGPQSVDGKSLAELAIENAKELTDERKSMISARNRFVGLVTRVDIQGVAAIIEIQSGSHHMVSMITADSAKELGLEVGSKAVASVKSTDVVIENGM